MSISAKLMELSNVVFDIKDKLTDKEYKSMMDLMGVIHTKPEPTPTTPTYNINIDIGDLNLNVEQYNNVFEEVEDSEVYDKLKDLGFIHKDDYEAVEEWAYYHGFIHNEVVDEDYTSNDNIPNVIREDLINQETPWTRECVDAFVDVMENNSDVKDYILDKIVLEKEGYYEREDIVDDLIDDINDEKINMADFLDRLIERNDEVFDYLDKRLITAKSQDDSGYDVLSRADLIEKLEEKNDKIMELSAENEKLCQNYSNDRETFKEIIEDLEGQLKHYRDKYDNDDSDSDIEEIEVGDIVETIEVLIEGVKCNECGIELEPHTEEEHLDINHKIHKCSDGCNEGHKRN